MSIKQLVIGAFLLLPVSSFAQEPSTKEVDSIQVPRAAQYLEMATKLVSLGRETKSALPLIQAVQIFRQLNVVDAPENVDSISSPFSEAQILADATRFADGNKNLIALIKDIEKITRGSLVDPKYGKLGGPNDPPLRVFRSVNPSETKEYKVSIESDQFVQVIVDGQGEGIRDKDVDGNFLYSDLRLKVVDRNGRTLGTDYSKGENCSVSFRSNYSTVMTIEVQNVGRLSDDYVLYIYRQ